MMQILLLSKVCARQGVATQRTFSGSGANEDVVVASARAYVSALNKLISFVSASQRAMEQVSVTASQEEPEVAGAVA